MESQVSQPELQATFRAKIDQAKTISQLVSAIHNNKREQNALCLITSSGLRFTVQDQAKALQANAYIESGLFQSFECSCHLQFRINLNHFLECINVFGSASADKTALLMAYYETEGMFQLTLEEDGVLTECDLRTMVQQEDAIDFNFRASRIISKAILSSDALKDAFSELAEIGGAKKVQIQVSPLDPLLRLISIGTVGTIDIEFPRRSDAFISFHCEHEQCFSYSLPLLQHALRALSCAKETFLRINEPGMLTLQHMIVSSLGQRSFVDFVIYPLDEDDF